MPSVTIQDFHADVHAAELASDRGSHRESLQLAMADNFAQTVKEHNDIFKTIGVRSAATILVGLDYLQ